MTSSRKRAMTWTLVALGILMVGLGAALIATFPWQQNVAQAGATVAPGSGPLHGPWYGDAPMYWHGYGWRHFHGPRFFGGGLLIAVLLVVLIGVAAGRWRRGHYEERLDAEEILRRSFAEGRISEEEYQSRLRALRK